jgi:D-galactarolactone cycloisomerase
LKIQKLEAFPVRLPRDHASAQGSAGSPHALRGGAGYAWSEHYPALYSREFEGALVRLTLDDGQVGWGESQAPLAPEVVCEIVRLLLGPALIGEDFDPSAGRIAARIASLWQRMYNTMRVRGHGGGFMVDAIAGVDLALWDLAAGMHALPLREMIAGGPTRNEMPAYVSGVPGANREAKLAFVDAQLAQGFRVFKLYFESDWQDLLGLVDAIQSRHAEAKVAVDALWHLPDGREVRCAQELAERRVLWLECPLPPEDVDAHARLVDESGVRLALGESYRTRHEAKPFFEREILSYWQPDLGRCGISETLELARIAQRAGVAIVPHVSIALPPQLQAAVETAAALGNCPLCEYNPSVVEMANRFAGETPFRLAGGAYQLGPLGRFGDGLKTALA